ncbi:MAG TPA: hypothetical protein VM940_10275 [Chthoniobacterales bacterium]|nr:hypothetical protein [Chthoniobacterales bacterium]
MKYTTPKTIAVALLNLAVAGWLGAAPPVADVGEAESFGHPALYMGAASGGFSLASSCDPAATSCFVLAPSPTTTTFTVTDDCRIKLPKKATRTIIYPALNFFVNYELENHTGVFQPQGLFFFRASIDVESDALLDPTIIDPSTGSPAAGKFRAVFNYTYRDDRSMQVNDRQRQQMTLVRVGNGGINKAFFVGQGVPQAVVDAMFAGPITLRMNVEGEAKLCDFASVTTNMRLFGD